MRKLRYERLSNLTRVSEVMMEMGFEPSSNFRANALNIIAIFECITNLEINDFLKEDRLKIGLSYSEVKW